LAEVDEDGSGLLTKLEGSGGTINMQTCREQLLYEVMDPSRYVTPDVTADFTGVRFEQEAPNRMRVNGGSGTTRPPNCKVSIGIHDGVMAEGQISYAGPGALARAELARDILGHRLGTMQGHPVRFELIGLNALHGTPRLQADPYEIRLRAAACYENEADAKLLVREVESLYLNGPAGGAGITYSVRENIAILPALIARDLVKTSVWIEEA
jgi:hypothetical protein